MESSVSKPRAECHPDREHKAKGLCAPCYRSKIAREWWARPGNREKKRERELERQYGLTGEDFLHLLASQGNKCAICQKPLAAFHKHTHVDHCHETKIVRGILCSCCNTGLGQFRDSQARLEAAISYLQKVNDGLR